MNQGLRTPFESQAQNIRNQFLAPKSTSEVWDAAVDLGAEDRELRALQRKYTVREFNKIGPKLPLDELTKKYPDVDWKEPTTHMAAQHIADAHAERKQREQVLANAPEGFFSSVVVPFAGRALSAMMDPIGFGIGAALSLGTGAAISMAGKTLSTAGKFGVATTEALAANTMAEGLILQASKEELMDYTAEQALTNVVAGSLLMTGTIHGTGAMFRMMGKAGAKHMDSAFRLTQVQMENDVTPNLSEVMRHVKSEMEINTAHRSGLSNVLGDERANRILDGSEDLRDMYSKLESSYKNGEISPQEMSRVSQNFSENGADNFKFTKDNPDPFLPSEAESKIKEYNLSEESRMDYDAEMRAEMDELNVPQDQRLTDLEAEIKEERAYWEGAERDGIATPEQSAELRDIIDTVNSETEKIDIQKKLAYCLTGA